MKKEKFNIQGMTCSSCSAHVDKAVRNLSGIKDVNVNLLSNSMQVEFDENIIDEQKIISAVVDAGYGAEADGRKNKRSGSNKNTEIQKMKKRLILSFAFLIPLMYIAMHGMLENMFNIPVPGFIKNIFHGPENALNFCISQLLLVIPIIWLNRNYFIVGFKRLLKRSPNMDSLISLGATASVLYGIFAMYMIYQGSKINNLEIVNRYSSDIYFESAGTILTLITFGKYLEAKSKGKTSDAISKLINLAPKTAIVINDGIKKEVPVEEICVGDIIEIKPGSSIPVDGEIIDGSSSIDQSSITGESIPIEKVVGDTVVSGTINKNGYFKMKATKVGGDTTLSQIIRLVEEASNSKAPISKLADKVSGVFVPIVIIIAIFAFVFWKIQGMPLDFALSTAIAVLVISCPCALGLATPVAIMVGTGKGAQSGILIKSAESLELLHRVDVVVFDKTGTITEGKPKVTDIITSLDEREFLKIAVSLEKKSEHPLAESIIEKANSEYVKSINVNDFISVSGRGIQGKVRGIEYFSGNKAFILENKIKTNEYDKLVNKLQKEGKTVLYFANKDNVVGIIAVKDTIKNTSKITIEELRKRNISTIMITGDNKSAGQCIAKEVGIEKVIAEVLPQDKETEVSNLQKQGKKVAFVGDGINDSPALVRADVGIAISSGTDIAIESADIVLVKNTLTDVVNAIDLSKTVINNIKMNLFWAFFYNSVGIPVAAGAFYLSFGLKLNPMLGAAAMSLSSVCVVTNALRIKKFKSKINYKSIKEEVIIENKEEKKNMEKTIMIDGMSCNHCKRTVEKVLNSIDGVLKAEVSLEEKCAKIEIMERTKVENETIKNLIEEEGFTVVDIK